MPTALTGRGPAAGQPQQPIMKYDAGVASERGETWKLTCHNLDTDHSPANLKRAVIDVLSVIASYNMGQHVNRNLMSLPQPSRCT